MKKKLRQEISRKRQTLATSEVLEKSNTIKHRLFDSKWYQDAHNILFYISYNNEVHTHEMIRESLEKGKNVMVPKIDTHNKTLIASLFSCWDDLGLGPHSILEPKNECVREVPLSSIDLYIIPGIVFDDEGNRIGHGGGYYDRLLKKECSAHRIGLAFELQIIKRIPAEPHDKKVERIITEERTILCS
ncbi:MAG: 5-formyltetrahydrofolate cyclo-ligase [Candidatus Thermoplasmatota archaeon]|nr:5-formyltetrahydrofolate cyclo-ligase [Candidatus Thermoplasmatota archaeon]